MLINEQSIRETWQPLLQEKAGIKDVSRLNWLSRYCHYHSLNEAWSNNQVNESFGYSAFANLGSVPGMGNVTLPTSPGGVITMHTGATGSGDKFPSLLPMAIQVAARTVGFDIVPVIPMPGPVGVLTYLDYVYAGGKTGTADQPFMIKINASNINSTNYVKNTKYWGVSQAADGSKFTSGDHAVELLFVGYSTIDGYPIFRVGSTYEMTGTTNAKTADETITISSVFEGSAVIVADATNAPSPTNAAGTTIAVTARATLVKALEDHIVGFVGAGTYDQEAWAGGYTDGTLPVGPMGRGTGESTYYRTMGLQAFTKSIEAETFQVAATVTTEQIQDLNKQFGIDVVAMIENALVNEISQGINKHILSRAFALGWTNNAEYLASNNATLNFTVDRTVLADGSSPSYLNKIGFTEAIAYRAYQDFGDFENLSTIQRRIKTKTLAAGNIIAQRGRRGPANFCVTNIQLATALQDTAQYSFAPIDNTINQNNGSLYPVGTVAGMTIYVDPYMAWDDTRILVGRKGADEEPGLKFMPYLMAESIQTIAEQTMAPKIAVKSRYALVEAGFWPETQYYTIYIHCGSIGII